MAIIKSNQARDRASSQRRMQKECIETTDSDTETSDSPISDKDSTEARGGRRQIRAKRTRGKGKGPVTGRGESRPTGNTVTKRQKRVK
jgi:hypothetical protein